MARRKAAAADPNDIDEYGHEPQPDLSGMTEQELHAMVEQAYAEIRAMVPADVYQEIRRSDDEYFEALEHDLQLAVQGKIVPRRRRSPTRRRTRRTKTAR